MKKFFESKAFCLIISLIFALVLFFMVHDYKLINPSGSNYQQDDPQLTSNASKQVEVPLQLNVDSDKYFVIGYPDKVKVDLKGPSALVTTTANTQNFKVTADLSNLTPGRHVVKLQQSGLNSELHAKIQPEKIEVNIQNRETDSYPVAVKYQKSHIATGYKVGKIEKDVDKVNVTGPADEMDKIKKVVAEVNLTKDTDKTFDKSTVIDALDSKGRTVNVVISPSTTKVKLPINKDNEDK
ncbi:hypothetical protein BGL34_04955 [Fructilactobacillus lindneri]|uniref:YbbR-like protein n=2 Tax=Fructilactobacillus lindneri TaxID=53444 RepID=A0A0R2JQ70_9LACO|nr:CdaR family protein [Fructilactobacillus lindneri]ANZ58432.1 hypothetical protein AYR60_06665 [Fructilactobacillus lindneri]ANZ59742.1 hypothetical protein AYR59_06855 [Fructilactobacillus lindneri]KRN79262.1 hypothetical protein IV52_GL000671 [Fructilactobacillus lindneri DSM 20690 = JCM 11027]POG98463.1 hypothetical protein BGL31_00505 [Fructilactobacillus lindneri]POH03863.1 hypothetical protein BGL32_00510 [Fructilactobacillus lindneri]